MTNSVLEMVRRRQEERAQEAAAKERKLAEIRQQYEERAEERRAEQGRREREQQEQRDLLARQRQEHQESQMKAQALASWKRGGGGDADFEDAWPGIKRDLLASRAIEDMKQAQVAAAKFTHERF